MRVSDLAPRHETMGGRRLKEARAMPTHEYASKLCVPSWLGQYEESANGVGGGSRGHWLSCNVHQMYT